MELLLQEVFRQQEEGNAHEGQGFTPLAVARELQGASGLQVLGPTQSHAATVRMF